MIEPAQLVRFKASCEENSKIVQIIEGHFLREIADPILDVGAGMGDISAAAFNRLRVVHLDVNDFSVHPIPPLRHRRIRGDFFDVPRSEIGAVKTMLFSHVLQFIDANIERLNARIHEIDPTWVLAVFNKNDGLMGELVNWFQTKRSDANPECDLPGFVPWMKVIKEVEFSARLSCETFISLATQASYLMDCQLTGSESMQLEEYLKAKLQEPAFSINQIIRLYRVVNG